MRLKRDLFFTLILFLIIFSISFVSASELTYDSNTDELTTLSVSDVNSIDEDLNDVKLDSVGDDSNDELKDSVDDNLDESELNSIDDTSSPSLDLEDDEQDIDEIESNDCLTLNDKAQLLRASNDEDILGAGPYTRDGNVIRFYDDGTVSNIMDAINELNDLINSGTLANGVVCLDGHTFSGSGNLNDRTIRNIWVIGGHDPWDYSKYATFSDTGIAMWFSGTTMDNCRFSNIISVGRLASCSVNYDSGSQTFRGSMSNTIFEYCQSYAQFISYNGNRGNAPSPIQNQTIPLEPGWNGQTYKVTNCQFLYCNQTFNGFEDGHGQFCAALAADFDGCKFINTTSGQHSGAICIADESEWGPGYVPSSIKNCDFINVTSRWFAVYIHGRYSTSPYSGMYGYEVVENCNFINCTGTDEYSAGLGISHDNVYIKNCNFTDNKGGQGTAIMVGGISKDKGSMGDTAFNGDNTKGNNITIIDCTFKNNIATVHACDWPDSTSNGCGGAVYIVGNDTKVINCNFDSNHADGGNGAAIYIEGLRTNITGTTFTNHESENGTVYIEGNNTNIQGCTFENNEADNGAGIFIDGNNAAITGTTFKNNLAEKGAGIFIEGQNTNIGGSAFDSNNATDGGAVYIDGDNSIIYSNQFLKNNVTDQGGAIYIEGSGSTIRRNTFTENEAVPASAEGTTGLGGAIYVKGDNTLTDTNTFEHNKARNGSAIYTDGKNFNLQHDVFNENQAWSYLLIVDPVPKVSYYNTTDHNITIVHVGGDNIINAIHNTANNNEIHFLDVTYRHSDGDTVNTGDTVVEPVDGAREGVKLYQDDRENLQEIFVTVTHVESGDIILNYERYVTNIYGEVNITLKRPTRAVIQLDNPLPVGNYSVYAIHPEDWNYKVIENRSAFEILPYVDISTEKDSDKDEYYVGDTAIWTITVHNADNGTNATNVTVTDKLPSGFAFVSYVASQGNYDANTGIWYIGNMTNGSTVQLTINSIATFADNYNNIANASSNETDWNLTNNEDNKTVTVLPVVNLTIDKSVNVDVVYVGENVIFTINVTNNGPSNATMVKVEDVLPEQFEYVTSNDTSFSGNQIIIPKLNVGNSYLFTITAKTLINGTWNNTANATCKENDTVVNDTATVTVLPVVNLTIDKSVDLGHVKVGDTVVFTINVTNNGPSNATNVVIEDVVPTQFNVTGCSNPRFENNKITISYLNKGESIQFTITAVALINGTWNNTANATCDENDTVVNDTVEVIVDPVVNLTIDKAVDFDRVFVGDTVVFTINVTNNGPSNATQVVIEDIVPEQFQVTGCNDTAFSGNKITVDKLNVGDSYAFTITATALIAGTWNNTANATCKENDTIVNDTVTVIVDPVVNLTINKTVEPGRVKVGETVVFTINVTNNGPSNATQVVIEDIVPEQFNVTACNDTSFKNNKITIDQLNVGESYVITINATALIAGTWNNTANVTCKENDTIVNDTVNVTVDPVVNLTIDKAVNIDHVFVGDTVVFTINVTNNGPSNATQVVIEDIVPEQFNVTACNDTSFKNNKITIDQLNVGESYAFTITATTLINGTWNNTANVTCKENDTVINDTVTVIVDPVVNLTINKTVEPGTVKVGETVVFTINVTNNGPSNATQVVIEDIVPEQFNVTACSDTSYSGNKLVIDHLNAGESYAFTITATALIAGTWDNTANVTCAENDTVVNDTVTVVVDTVVNLTIDKAVDIDRVQVGETVVFTINVTNNGPSNATVVTIEDIVPEQFNVTGCNDTSFKNNKLIIDQLNVGESYAFTITATALIAGTWNNTANVTCKENDTVINDTVTVIVDPVVNLTINKTVDNNHVQVGETVVFTINVTNNGPSNATQVVIEDVVPGQFGNVVCNDSRYEDNKIIIEQLNTGDSIVFTLTATALINGTWNNTANVTCAENDTVVNDTVNVTVDPVVNLTINKTVDLDRVSVGDTIVFTINVTNNGPSNATQVVIEDIVPAQFNVTACSDDTYSDNKIIIEKLDVGESYAFTITATALINGTWVNVANVTCDENDTVVEDNATVTVDTVVNLTIDKAVDIGRVYVGDTVVFTINVTNNGPSNATQVVIEDIVPAQFNVTACSDDTYTDNKITITQLNVGESYAFTITATALIAGTWNNTANVTCKENDTVINDTVEVIVDPVVNLTIDKTVEPGHVQVGETVVFTINVTNNGPSNATQVVIEDVVPTQFGNVKCNDSRYEDNKIIIEQLNTGDSIVFTLTATALINGTWNNTANVTCAENDTVVNDTVNVTVDPVVNLTIDKTVDIEHVQVGDTIVFTINITNNGPSNATVVTIEDIVPAQFNVTACSDDTYSDNKIIIEKLDVGESYAFTITATALINGTWNNTANVTCAENDTVVNDTVTVIVDPVVNLSINKTVEPGRVYVGETVLFTIIITNNGPSNATQVEVTDIVPEQFGNVKCNDTRFENNKIIIERLDVGESYVFTLNATALINGTWDNIASAFCAENDTVVEDDAIVIVDPVVNLTVNKTVEPGKVYVGETVVFTINVTNNGPSNATMVEISDIVPEQFGNVVCNDSRFENNKIIIERLEVGESIVFTLTATALTNGTWNNTASAFCEENETIVNDTVNVTVDPIVDLSTNKTSDQDVYFVEDIAIWTITVHNANNASNATNVKLIESLPAEFEYIDYYTLNGTYDNETKIWDIGFMANGTDARLIILARAIKVKDNVTNVVAVTCTERDWNLSNNIANKTVDILPLPDPEKNVSNSTPYYHDEVLYYLTINNTGNVTYENVLKVIDSLPEGLEFIRTVSIENANLTDDESVEGQTITWTITNIPAFTKAVITVLVKVNALGNLTNNLTIIGPNGSNQTVNATIDPVPIVDLSTNKTSDKEAYFVDDIVIWSITVHNADNGTNATDVILKDEIPSQFEFINYTATKGTYDKETGIWNISFMENGTNATLTIWTIAKVAVDQVTNTANVTCKETDWNLSNNVDNETVEIIPLPDPVKTVSNSTPYYHDIVEYNLTIINDGDIDYTNNLTVVDTLPEGLVFIETIGIENGNFVGDEVIGTNNVTWVITNISAKTSATIKVKVKVEALGDLTNNLTIIGPNGTNKTVNETVTPVPIVDLSTDKTSDRDEYFVDDIAVWTITVHNADNGTNATNVALEDHIPTQFVFINYTATNGTYDHNTGIWTIGSMGNGTDATLTIWTRAVTLIDEVTNYANVSCYEDEWDLSNNDDEKTVTIIKLPEPEKTVSNATPYNRDNVTYNLTITNVGNVSYTNVLTVIDSLPEGLKFIETVGIDGADLIEEIVDGQKITWTITNISAESSAVITVKVLVMDIGNQTNNLTIVGPYGTNSTVNCTIDPVPIADLEVTKINDYSTKVCYNGDTVTWTISVINNGPNDAINSIASDILPAGLIYVSDDSNGAYDDITGIWTIGNLSVGSSATLTIVTTVATSNETITNYVNVTSDTYDPDESNNKDNSSIVVEPEADLGIIKLVSNETVHKGDIVTWTLIVTNYGTDAAINVVVTDKLPKGLEHIADNSLGAYNPVTGIWKVGNLASGESATLKIKSLVTTTNKNITNLATVDSDTYDPDESNNKANNSTTVPPECDLELTIDPNVVEVTVGDEVEFTVTVVNKGPDTAENATAFIEIPEELKLLGFKPSKGTYDPETGIWTIGDLAPGEKVTLILDTEALETGKFVVKANVVCDTYETDYTNNNDSAEVTVIEPPEPPVPGVPPQEMYPTGNPIVLALLSVLVIVGMTLRRKS